MDYTFFIQLILSILLGGIVGWQRAHIGKAAGSRTYSLVCMGSMLFTLLSLYGFGEGDSSRVAAQIITGIGFIGAGTILHKKDSVEGLTTAAGLWAIAAIGMAIGVEWFLEAIIATFIMFLVLLIDERKFGARQW